MAGNGLEGWTDVLHRSQQQQQQQQHSSISEEPHPQSDADATSLAARSSIRMQSGMVSKESPDTIRGPDSSSKPLSRECGSSSTDSDQAASPSVSESQEDDESDDPSKPKKDRSTLRKGKWTVEEEEFTSRIIQHFSIGLLILPEGATLRSYLADKLNCDPMRITKKFTGACCLGRRVYHLRDRPQATHAEVALAQAELSHLEQRFRLRVEHDHSGLQLGRRPGILLAQPPNLGGLGSLFPLHNAAPATAAAAPSWLQNYAALAAKAPLPLNLAGIQNLVPAMAQAPPPVPFAPCTAGPWLLPNNVEATLSAVIPPPVQQDPSLLLLSNAVNNWAWAQAAASLTPAISQLAASNVQQQQQKLRQAFEEQLRANASAELSRPEVPKPVAPALPSVASVHSATDSPAQQLARSYEAHLQSLREQRPQGQGFDTDASLSLQSHSSDMVTNQALSSMTQRNVPHSSLSSAAQILPKQLDSITTHQLLLRQALANAAQAMHDSTPVGGLEQLTPLVNAPGNPPRQAPKNAVQETPLSHIAPSKAQNEISNHMILQSLVASLQSVTTTPQMQYPHTASSAVLTKVVNPVRQEETQSLTQQQQNSAGVGEGVKQDEEAATSLIGLLNSLRQSYEDAVGSNTESAFLQAGEVKSDIGKKQVRLSGGKNAVAKKKASVAISVGEKSVEEDVSASKRFHRNSRRKNGRAQSGSSQMHPTVLPKTVSTGSSRSAYVTDTSTLSRSETSSGTSSQPNESSLDDSDSKTDPSSDPSSSEESYEKEYPIPQRSQGPPRKRHKARRQVQEFTTENVLQHSERMKQEADRSQQNGAY